MKTDKFLDVRAEHECKGMRKCNNVAIQFFNNDKWYFVDYNNNKTILHGIKYCPYCGEELI